MTTLDDLRLKAAALADHYDHIRRNQQPYLDQARDAASLAYLELIAAELRELNKGKQP